MNRHATIWIDTEFNGWGGELISLALVDDNDRQFYEVLECKDPQAWVAEHVLPVLGQRTVKLEFLQMRLQHWLRAYDWVHLVADWPDDVAYFCRALITGPGERIDTPAITFEIRRDLDAVSAIPHNALEDAKAMRARHLQMMATGPRGRSWIRQALNAGRALDCECAEAPEALSHNASAARAGGEGGSGDEAPNAWAGAAYDEMAKDLEGVSYAAAGRTSDAGVAGVVSACGALVAPDARALPASGVGKLGLGLGVVAEAMQVADEYAQARANHFGALALEKREQLRRLLARAVFKPVEGGAA